MYALILLAAGNGRRSGLAINKIIAEINGKPLISYTLDHFKKDKDCQQIILVVKEDEYEFMQKRYQKDVEFIVIGGELRQDSVYAGLQKVASKKVLIHDGARPYVTQDMIDGVNIALDNYDAVSLAMPIYDTVKKVTDGFIEDTIDRESLMMMQTPQGFTTEVLKKAYLKRDEKEYTCDVTLVKDVLKIDAKMVLGSKKNIKFTTQDDLELLEMILS